MKITIENIVGGDRHTLRTLESLARLAMTREPYGGFRVVERETSADALEDAQAVCTFANGVAEFAGLRPRNPRDVERCIATCRSHAADRQQR